jgi:hypothetical protein
VLRAWSSGFGVWGCRSVRGVEVKGVSFEVWRSEIGIWS